LDKIFWEVSDPESPKYGKHLSIQQITSIVKPKDSSIETVLNWLHAHGIKSGQYRFNANKDFLHVRAPVFQIETLLHTQFHEYQQVSDTFRVRRHITAINPYSVPSDIFEHIDFIKGFAGFPSQPMKRNYGNKFASDPLVGAQDLRKQYNVTSDAIGRNPRNRQAVAEFQAQYYDQPDLQQYFKQYWPSNTNSSWWTVNRVIGTNQPSNPGDEACLDIQVIMGVAPGVPTDFYSNANFDFWSDITKWCSDLSSDAQAAYVQSVSYGSQGNYPSTSYRDRINTEFQKLGARGLTIVFASGDSGTGCQSCWTFAPSFPATSPYVLSVGATHLLDGTVGGPEGAVTAFSSGGGMSWHFPIPSYQTAAVNYYFQNGQGLPSAGYYNRNGRGTPDVAALGIGFGVIIDGTVNSIGGTSASAPTFAAIITLLNEIRLNANHPVLGFINPFIYQTAAKYGSQALWDVTVGNNQYSCCGFTGFPCYTAWDPVTGYGTPNFAFLKTLV